MRKPTNTTHDFKVGQIWKYNTRSGEEESRIYIVKTAEEKGYGTIFHIHVDGLRIKNPRIESGVQNDISHAPVDIETLNASVKELESTQEEMPSIEEGYQIWKEAFDKNEAGIFTIPVSEIAKFLEGAINGKYKKV